MDKLSDEQKLKWFTIRVAPQKRAIINTDENEANWQIPKYKVSRFQRQIGGLQRQIKQISFGKLGKLPLELLCMVFQHLTCDDLETLTSCSTGGHIAVLGFSPYYSFLKYAPAILVIFKETQLARSFNIMKVYKTFNSSLSANCGQFAGYVFLSSFT